MQNDEIKAMPIYGCYIQYYVRIIMHPAGCKKIKEGNHCCQLYTLTMT